MATQITATLPTLAFPKEVDYPTQEDWAAFSADAELNFGILGGSWSTQMQLWKNQANAMSIELNTNATIAQGLANYQGDWTSKGYTLNQTVSVGGIYYICKLTHATGQNPTTGGSLYWNLALGNWSLKADKTEVALKVNNYGNETIAGVKTFTLSPIVPTPTTDNQAANKQYVDNTIIDRIGLINYGYVAKNYHIVAFGGEFNRADYPKLWAYLAANLPLVKTEAQWTSEATTNGGICGFFSNGNGTTTFRVPNLNKAFLRPDDRTVGSYQGDAFQGHWHSAYSLAQAGNGGTNNTRLLDGTNNTTALPTNTVRGAITDGTNGDPRTSNETRPKNIAVLPLIVAK